MHGGMNVVPCCNPCNNKKQQRSWNEFLVEIANDEFEKRKKRIDKFTTVKKYDPKLNLRDFADNLYEDVGSVAMTLIQLRYKQAKIAIEDLLEN